jgi:hypothetical protein
MMTRSAPQYFWIIVKSNTEAANRAGVCSRLIAAGPKVMGANSGG